MARIFYIAGIFISGLSVVKIIEGEYTYILPCLIGFAVGVFGRSKMNNKTNQ
jgi:hypothetical protein